MGNCGATQTEQTPEERIRINHLKAIETELNKKTKAKQLEEDHIAKLLLLGTGESGKSTVFRQMIKLFGDGFKEDQRITYRAAIYQNIIDAILVLLKEVAKREEAKETGFALGEKAKQAVEAIQSMHLSKGEKLNPSLGKYIKALWDDAGFKLTYYKRMSVQISESVEYFFDQIEKLCDENYIPSDDDVLHVRIKTSGLIKEDFKIENLKFRLHDVGGQRNERRKWIHCFEDVTAVIFITAISEYDQVCYEDEETNRMVESLNLFEELANSRWFVNTAMILFLNKQDLFDKKFSEVPLRTCFPDWNGTTREEAYDFIKEKFTSRLSRRRDIFSHVTTATESDNIYKVFHAVRHIIVKSQLTEGGFL